MSVIVNILAAIGLIVIISYLVYYLYQYIVKMQSLKEAAQMNPPGNYMQNSGIKCPDYWVNTGVDNNGNYICENTFNIQTNSSNGTCNSSTMKFPPVTQGYTWDYGNPNGLTSLTDEQKYNFVLNTSGTGSMTRCNWINSCGPSSTVQGVWSGVNELCNSPPPSVVTNNNYTS